MNAPSEIHDTLSNLQQSLYEERFYIGRIRRRRGPSRRADPGDALPLRIRGAGTDQSLRAMGTAVRHMCAQFERLEEPYLTGAARRLREKSRRRGYGADRLDELWNADDVRVELGEGADFYDAVYAPPGWRERFRWIRNKGTALSLWTRVQRIQIRRIAIQTSEIVLWVHF